MNTPLVSVVIVGWNRGDDILTTLPSVYQQTYPRYEVIVVDNGSTDQTVERVRTAFPQVQVIALDQNLGPTGGRNVGVLAAAGDIIFFLDSDASMQADTLEHAVCKFANDGQVGAIGCKVLNAHTGRAEKQIGWSFATHVDANREFASYTFSETGCAVRREALDKAGLFWEFLFFGREGEELSLRILDAGYKILYCPSSVVHHRESPYKRVQRDQRRYLDLRNCLYIYLARYPWWMLLRFFTIKIGISLVRGLHRRNVHTTLVPALSDLTRAMPTLLRARAPIKPDTAQRYLQLQREHGPLSWNMVTWIQNKL